MYKRLNNLPLPVRGVPPPRSPRPGDAPPAAACGALASLVTATSLGVHNISMDGRPIAQERAGLVADGLAVPCELLAAEFGAHFGVKKGARLPPPRELPMLPHGQL